MASQSQPSDAPKRAVTDAPPSASFTPGPWRVVPYDCGDKDEWPGTPSIQAPPELDCAIVHWAGFKQRYWESARGRSEMEANARLIAAAPDLYEALKLALTGLEFFGKRHPAIAEDSANALSISQIRAALTKAEAQS